MKRLFFYICFFVFISASTAWSASRAFLLKQCRETMKANPPQVDIVYNYGELSYDFSKSSDEISDIYESIYHNRNQKELLGLTKLMAETVVNSRISYVEMSSGHKCFFPAVVQVRVWYSNPVVYISNKLEQGSCFFRQTVRHEQTHLDFGHLGLYLYALGIKNNIAKLISDVDVRVSKDEPQDVINEMSNDYYLKLLPQFNIFKDNLTRLNMLIDSKQNYQEEYKNCQGK